MSQRSYRTPQLYGLPADLVRAHLATGANDERSINFLLEMLVQMPEVQEATDRFRTQPDQTRVKPERPESPLPEFNPLSDKSLEHLVEDSEEITRRVSFTPDDSSCELFPEISIDDTRGQDRSESVSPKNHSPAGPSSETHVAMGNDQLPDDPKTPGLDIKDTVAIPMESVERNANPGVVNSTVDISSILQCTTSLGLFIGIVTTSVLIGESFVVYSTIFRDYRLETKISFNPQVLLSAIFSSTIWSWTSE